MKNLIEILSEKPFPGKPLSTGAAAKMRVQQIDNAGRALKFTEDMGVVMELKCSAENLVDGLEKPVLGLVWGIMRTFMKFGNEDSKMKASDALLGWVKNQVVGYKNRAFEWFMPFLPIARPGNSNGPSASIPRFPCTVKPVLIRIVAKVHYIR